MVGGVTPGAAAPEYNNTYERLVDQSDPEVSDIRGWIAYGKYKAEKKEWCERLRRDHGRSPTAEDLAHWQSTIGDNHIKGLLEQADQTVEGYALAVISDARPGIVKETLKGKFWNDVLIGMMAAFLYTLLLILAAVVLKLMGLDFLSVYEKLGSGR